MNVLTAITLIVSAFLGTGGLAALIRAFIQHRREPVEQDLTLTTSNNLAIQSLQISHSALHKDVEWMTNALSDLRRELIMAREEGRLTRERLAQTRVEHEDTKRKLAATETNLVNLMNAWSHWWDDLSMYWEEYRQRDRPPPRPDATKP